MPHFAEFGLRWRARALLARGLGPGYDFRPGQWEAVAALVGQRRRLLLVQPTGWGKSLVYFLATRLLRDQKEGPTLLVSPLLSLMRNQLAAAERLGVRAVSLNSENTAEWGAVRRAIQAGEVDLILISPERLANEEFRTRLLPFLAVRLGLFAVDEAHCISDWGHDFRPDYRRIVRVVRLLPPTVRVLATTATANERVIADVQEQLGPSLEVQRGPLARPSLRLHVVPLADQAERLAWLAHHLPRLPGTGIIYCLTVADCRRVSRWLTRRGLEVPAYHADVGPERGRLEEDLLANRVKALAATVALGMGFDKPDVAFVIHYQRPGSAIAYYQQIGRAGRAVDDAPAVLLAGQEEDEIEEHFIRTAFAAPEEMEAVLALLDAEETVSLTSLQQRLNMPYQRLEKALKLLQVEQAIGREGQRFFRTPNPWRPDAERLERVTARRRRELERMREYVRHPGCLMEFLLRELDDPNAAPCGRCARCAGDRLAGELPPALVQEAVAFLRGDFQVIFPRRRWPDEGPPERRGQIPPDLRLCEGRALCVYGDAGWGRMVARGKYEDGRFSAELVAAAAELISERWRPQPQPEWVACVPSLRHPELVPAFARQLAAALGLPFAAVVRQRRPLPEQKTMRNSVRQARNAIGGYAVDAPCPRGAALLVDDMVDSRWTLTEIGALLRAAGSGPVHPFTLAVGKSRN